MFSTYSQCDGVCGEVIDEAGDRVCGEERGGVGGRPMQDGLVRAAVI